MEVVKTECPLNFFQEKQLRMIALFTAGLLAGENYGINLYAVPMLKDIEDPKERSKQFTRMYTRGKHIAMSSSIILTGSLLALYCKTKDRGLWCPISLSLLKIPITFLFMHNQYNNKLMNGQISDLTEMDELLEGWRYWHWIRVTSDVCAFVAVICTVLYKKNQ